MKGIGHLLAAGAMVLLLAVTSLTATVLFEEITV